MRVALAGAGAFGIKHLDALTRIDGVEIAAVVSRRTAASFTVCPSGTDIKTTSPRALPPARSKS